MAVLSNTMMQGTAAISEDTDYQIEKSLRFNPGDSPSLIRDFPGGNARIWTLSCWCKGTDFDNASYLISCGANNDNVTAIRGVSNTLRLYWNSGGGITASIITNRVFRDPSAWYNIVVAIDTTQSTSTERVKIYINGKQETSFSTATYPSQWARSWICDQTYITNLGSNTTAGGDAYKGYLADFYLIDGLQLSPAAFGSFDSLGVWNPKAFALPAPNDGTTWTSSVTGTQRQESEKKENAFDGDLSTVATPMDGTNYHLTFEPSTPITIKQSLRLHVWANNASGNESGVLQINDNNNILAEAYTANGTGTATKWYTVPWEEHKGELKKIKWVRAQLTDEARIAAIEVDGVILVDGQTDKTYNEWSDANPNNGTKWSDYVSNHASSGNQMFDGREIGGTYGNAGTPVSLDLTDVGSLTYTNTIRAKIAWYGSSDTLEINGTDVTSNMSSGNKWYDISSWFSGNTLTTAEWTLTSGQAYISWEALEIDGYIIQDSTGNNSCHLNFNDADKLGKDTLDVKLSRATGGLPIYNTTDDIGAVKGSGYRSDPHKANLILAIPGDTVADVSHVSDLRNSGSAKTITAHNSATTTTDESRFYGTALYCNDTDNHYFTVADDFAFGTSDFTVECWFKDIGYPVGNAEGIYQSSPSNDVSTSYQLSIRMEHNGGTSRLGHIRCNTPGGDIISTINIDRTEWHHVALTKASNVYKVWIDGKFGGTKTSATSITEAHCVIGAYHHDGYVLTGSVNDFRVYSGVAKYTSQFKVPTRNSFNEVNNLTTTTSDDGSVAGSGWRTDSPGPIIAAPCNGGVLSDFHANVNDTGSNYGILGSGGDEFTDDSAFYGSCTKLTTDRRGWHTSNFNIADGAFTLEFWMRPNDMAGQRGIFQQTNSSNGWSNTYAGGIWGYFHPAGTLVLNLGDAAGGSITGIEADKWYHIAISRNASGVCKFFKNGALIATTTGLDSTAAEMTGEYLWFGGYYSDSYRTQDCAFNDIRFYTHAKYTAAFTVPHPDKTIATYAPIATATGALPIRSTVEPVWDKDHLIDTPTSYEPAAGSDATGGVTRGNYCTFNPLTNQDWGYGKWILTEGNLVAHSNSGSAGSSNRLGCTIGASTGKWYWEVEILESNAASGAIGINKEPTDYHANFNAGTYIIYQSSGDIIYNGGTYGNNWGTALVKGDVVGVQWDADNGSIYFWRNGVIQASGAAALTGMSGIYTPCVVSTSSGNAMKYEANFGQRAFKYTNAGTNRPSADYKCLCTQNLPDTFSGDELNNPSKYFDVKTWAGTGASNAIKGLGFQPDLLWLKSRSAAGYDHTLFDAARGVNKGIYTNGDWAEDNYSVHHNQTSFDSNGWTMGAASNAADILNETGGSYVGFAWDAGTAVTNYGASDNGADIACAVWKNTTAGFSIVKWTSDAGNSNSFMNHGLGTHLDFVIIKNLTTASSWIVLHDGLGTDTNSIRENHLVLDTTGAMVDKGNEYFERASNVVFGLRHDIISSSSSDEMIAYCWAAIPGFSQFGQYEGTGTADGPFIYTGFQPKWLLIKCCDGHNWVLKDTTRNPYNPSNGSLLADGNQAETDWNIHVDILSNGFKLKGASESNSNKSGENHIYSAFAELPFKLSRAR